MKKQNWLLHIAGTLSTGAIALLAFCICKTGLPERAENAETVGADALAAEEHSYLQKSCQYREQTGWIKAGSEEMLWEIEEEPVPLSGNIVLGKRISNGQAGQETAKGQAADEQQTSRDQTATGPENTTEQTTVGQGTTSGQTVAGQGAATEQTTGGGDNASAQTQAGQVVAGEAGGSADTVANLPRQILDCLNEERSAAGLATLSWSEELAAGAAVRSSETVGKLQHIRPDGSAFYTVSSLAMAENLAQGSINTTASEIVDLWMESEGGHKENILDGSLVMAGIAVYEKNGKITICALFG